MIESFFNVFNPHLDTCTILLSSAGNHAASVGSDDILFTLDADIGESHCLELRNNDRLQVTAFCMHPRQPNTFVFGTSTGFVKLLRPINQMQLCKAETIYKCDKAIRNVSFSGSGKFLAISTPQQHGIIYSMLSKRIFLLSQPHAGYVCKTMFAGDQYVFSIGAEGNLHLYHLHFEEALNNQQSESEDPFQQERSSLELEFIAKYKMTVETISLKYPFVNACFGCFSMQGQPQKTVLASGQTSLQKITLSGRSSHYELEHRIREEQEILLVEVISLGQNGNIAAIATSSISQLSVWNYSRKDRIFNIKYGGQIPGVITALVPITANGKFSFVFAANYNGKIYQLINSAVDFNQPSKQHQPLKKDKQAEVPYVSRWQEPVSVKLLPNYTQFILEKGYQQYQQSRFLFYNSKGCIIERLQKDASSIQLELHDKSRLNRLKIDAKSRPYNLFALRDKILLCATSTVMIFQEEQQLKEDFQGWELRWQDIQAVTIGGSWVAACSNEELRILDFSGNDLHCICFDRRLVTVEAFEDMLAVVYHGSVPMWGCQILKMRLYTVNEYSVKLERDVTLPIKSNSQLKWFGFSEEGMIYCQDNLEVLRCYSYESNEWHVVFSLEGKAERLFIQHIQGEQVFGFKIQQRQGEQEEPKVLPRSLPRRHRLEIRNLDMPFLKLEEQLHLKRIMLKNLLLRHDEFRWHRWYKLKYSRAKSHPWFQQSITIKSNEQIKTKKTEIDIQLFNYFSNFILKFQDKTSNQFQKIAKSLLFIIGREANYEQTKDKARNILITHIRSLPALQDYPVRPKLATVRKISQISILEQMVRVGQ